MTDVPSPSCFTPQQPSESAPADAPSPCCFTPPASSAATGALALAAAVHSTPLPRARKSLHFDPSAQPSADLLRFPRSAALATIAEEESDCECSDHAAGTSALPSTAARIFAPRQLPPSRAIVIRTLAQALKLADWETHYAPLTEAQCRDIASLYAKKAGWWKGAAAPLSKPAAAAAEAVPIPPTASSAAAASADVPAPPRKCTSNRWYHPCAVAQDWAEYRSCCGSLDVVAQHLAGSATAKLHSSVSVLNFFSVRLAYRALFHNRAAFATNVQSQLARARMSERSVLWDGGMVCASCFRSALGLSRSTIYAHRHLQLLPSGDGELDLADAELPLTAFGSLRKPRQRLRTAHVEALLLEYADSMGQTAPNPKGKNHDHQHIYLPHSRYAELAAALNRMDRAGGSVVKESTMRRVIAHLASRKYKLSLKPSNSMCRCEHCDLLDGHMEEYRIGPSRNKRLCNIVQAQKEAHLRQVKEQRDHFDEQKRTAEQEPSKLWCLTFDGMDQNKTQLPHLKGRLAKNLDGRPRLGVHAVGAFCFGAPVPVMGFLNTPDVRKDGSLSVAILDHALDIQYNKLEEWSLQQEAAGLEPAAAAVPGDPTPMDVDGAIAAAAGACPPHPPVLSASAAAVVPAASPAAAAAPAPGAPAAGEEQAQRRRRAYRSGAGLHWPERLHVTFDNAAGDAKNQWTFRYLGLLVLHGVFDSITVSTLIVGHTHDIVDQMFSVWAKLLCITDCKTYEQMRRLFHERYHSRVRLLIKLMKGAELSAEEAKDAGVSNAQQREELVEELAAEQAANPDQWNQAALHYTEQLEADLQRDAAAAVASSAGEQRSSPSAFHTPHVVRQTHSFNMKSFFESMTLPSGQSVLRERPMAGQTTPHVFGIETDKQGDVWLYNKHLAKSTEKSQRGERHLFLNCKTGDYTSRCLLFRAEDAASTIKEPPVNPPVAAVEVQQLRETISAYAKQGKLTSAEQEEWKQQLDAFAAAQQRLLDSCAECASLTKTLKDIGVVSHKKDLSEEDKLKQREKGRQRKQAQTQLDEHLRDVPHLGEQLQGSTLLGKWLQRVKLHIRPGYIERGVQDPPEYRTADYHVHPPALCTDGRSAEENPHNALFETDGRLDADYLLQQGPPQATFFALARCADAHEPFGFGIIHHVFAPGEVQPAFVNDPTKVAGLSLREWELYLQSARAAAPLREPEEEMVVDDASGDLLQRQLDKHAKGRRTVDMRAIPNVMMEWYNYPSTDVEKLRLLDAAWWAAQEELHAAGAAALRVRPESAPPARAWVVDMYKEIRFEQQQPRHRRLVFVQGSQLVGWHVDRRHFLRATKVLRADVFKKLRHDLTEQGRPAQAGGRRRQGANAAAAAQSSPATVATPSPSPARQRQVAARLIRKRPRASSSENEEVESSSDSSSCSSSEDGTDDEEDEQVEAPEEALQLEESLVPQRQRTTRHGCEADQPSNQQRRGQSVRKRNRPQSPAAHAGRASGKKQKGQLQQKSRRIVTAEDVA